MGATVGGPTYTVTATATSGLPVTFTIDASASTVCTIAGSTVSFIGAGTCVINANQAGNANYNAAPQVQQSFLVVKQDQTITFTSTPPALATIGGPTYTVTATATSGLPVTFTIDASASSVCTIAGSTVSFIGGGTCVINANQAGNAIYNAAPQVQQSFAVNNPPQLVITPGFPKEAFDTVGNTSFEFKTAQSLSPGIFVSGRLKDNFTDVDGPSPLSVVAITAGPTANGGKVDVDVNGEFTFTPKAGDTSASDSFSYQITDGAYTITRTVTIGLRGRVWYVKNNDGGGTGISNDPFATLAEAQTASIANDYIFVYFGNGLTTNQDSGIVLKNGQHLIGEFAGLTVRFNPAITFNGTAGTTSVLLIAQPGATACGGNPCRPMLDDTVAGAPEGVATTDAIPAEIIGLNLAGNVNAIDWTTAAAFAGTGELVIRDNIIRSATNEGVDINLAGTGATRLSFHDNNLTATGTALDIQETGTGALTIMAFDDNVVSGTTGGSGIVVSNAIFDSVPGGGLDTVNANTLAIGSAGAGNGVGGAGLALGNVQGDLHFSSNLNIFAEGGAGLTVSGTGAGFQFRVNSGGGPTGTIEATNGAAVDASTAALDLRLTSLRSTNSAGAGVSLTNVTGTFSAPGGIPGSSITNAGTTDFLISGGTANVTYGGTITDDVGQLVSVSGATAGTKSFTGAISDGPTANTGSGISLTGNGGATISFSGGLALSTGTNAAFTATGGGTLSVCDENPCNGGATGALVNTLTTTTGTALNVANTMISSNNLEFQSISSNGGSNAGIIVNTTGASGGLKVKGNGGAGTGGTIANKTGSDGSTTTGLGVYLNSTSSVSLAWMQLNDFDNFAIRGNGVTGFALADTTINALDGSPLNGTTQGEGGVGEGSIRFDNLVGTATISDSTITHGVYDNVGIFNTNTAAVLNLTVSNTTFATTTTTNTGNDALRIEIDDTVAGAPQTQANIVIQGDCDFTASRGDLLDVIAQKTPALASNAAVVDVDVIGNDFSNNHSSIASGGGGVIVHGQGNLTFTIDDNDLRDARGRALNLSKGATAGAFSGRINNNRIGVAGSAFSGSDEASGIYVDGGGAGSLTVAITNNQVRRTNEAGIFIVANNQAIGGNNATLNSTITGNVVAEPESALSFAGLWVDIGTGVSGDTSTACVDIGGGGALSNDFSTGDPFNGGDINLAVQSGSTFRLPSYGGANNNDGQITSYLTGRNLNPGTTAVSLSHTGTMTSNPGACVQP